MKITYDLGFSGKTVVNGKYSEKTVNSQSCDYNLLFSFPFFISILLVGQGAFIVTFTYMLTM
jgi:hypothetical protein